MPMYPDFSGAAQEFGQGVLPNNLPDLLDREESVISAQQSVGSDAFSALASSFSGLSSEDEEDAPAKKTLERMGHELEFKVKNGRDLDGKTADTIVKGVVGNVPFGFKTAQDVIKRQVRASPLVIVCTSPEERGLHVGQVCIKPVHCNLGEVFCAEVGFMSVIQKYRRQGIASHLGKLLAEAGAADPPCDVPYAIAHVANRASLSVMAKRQPCVRIGYICSNRSYFTVVAFTGGVDEKQLKHAKNEIKDYFIQVSEGKIADPFPNLTWLDQLPAKVKTADPLQDIEESLIEDAESAPSVATEDLQPILEIPKIEEKKKGSCCTIM